MSIANPSLPLAAARLVSIASNPQPGRGLLGAVRAGFIVQGTTLPKWCQANQIEPTHARAVLITDSFGVKTNALRAKLIAGAGLDMPQGVEREA